LIKNEQGLNVVFIAKQNRTAAETCNLLRNSSRENGRLTQNTIEKRLQVLRGLKAYSVAMCIFELKLPYREKSADRII
jgi:hypothetical protein